MSRGVVALIIFGVFLWSNGVLAQSGRFSIDGKTIDAVSKQPVEYVSVGVYSLPDSLLVGGTITNSLGQFDINRLKPGDYFLKADFIGFQSVIIDGIKLTPNAPLYHVGEISLSQKSLEISEVEVVSNSPSVAYKVDRKVITVGRDLAAQGGTAVEVLQNVPSVETDLEGNVSVRGSSNFKVLIDGRQSPLSGSDALNQISANTIDKIEIITNPSVKYDPDGTAGIINIITKKGKYNGVSLLVDASVGTSPLYTGNISLAIKKNRSNFDIGLSYQNQSFDMARDMDRERYFSNDSTIYLASNRKGVFSRENLSFKSDFGYMITDNNTFHMGGSLNYFEMQRNGESKNHEYANYYDGYYLSRNYFTVNPNGYQLILGDKQEFGRADHFISVEATFDNTLKNNIENRKQYVSNAQWDAVGIDTLLEARTLENESQFRTELAYQNGVSEQLTVEAGLLTRYRFAASDYSVYERSEPGMDWVSLMDYDINFDFERYINGGYLLFKASTKDQKLSYSGGLRIEHTQRVIRVFGTNDTSYNYTKLDYYPSASAAYTFANKNVLQFSYSRRIERPRDYILVPVVLMSDGFSSYVGNPELKPEYTDALELNYQFVWQKSFLAIETFYRKTLNAHDRVQGSGPDGIFISTYINLNSETYMGGEIGGTLVLAKWMTLNPAISFYYTSVQGEYNNEQRFREGYSGRGLLNSSFNIDAKTKFQLSGYYNLPQVTIDGKSYGSFYTSAGIKRDFLQRRLSVTASVDDIFNSRNRHMLSEDETFRQELHMHRYGPYFILSVSYRFNQSKENNVQRGNRESGEGMEMMF